MASVFINSTEVEVQPKENVIQAARRAGFEIPHYCWHHDLSVVASCRMCLVEAGTKKDDGSVVMQPRLVPACQTPATPNTVIYTDSAKVKASQAQTLEYLLLNHPLDCSICDQAGECYLQDYTFQFGKAESRLDEPKVQRLDKYHIGDQIALFTDRCVMCTRCVRFTREISGTSELLVTNRGSVEEIDVLPDQPCNNKLAGNVVDLCPVGALCSKDFLYKKRVWWLKSSDSVCTGCSTGCSISVDQNEDKVYRLRPRENPQAQGAFMCDDGRFGWKYIHSENRIKAPRLSTALSSHLGNGHTSKQQVKTSSLHSGGNGSVAESSHSSFTADMNFSDPWPYVLDTVRSVLKQASQTDPQRFLAILSPFMTCEEAYLLASYLKQLNPQFTLALGPVPVVGHDDHYPKGLNGASPLPEKTRFTIRAEKCPNRQGVEAILQHFQGQVICEEHWSHLIANSTYDTLLIIGGDPETSYSDTQIQAIKQVSNVIVLDILENSLTQAADIVLAGATFAEKEGTVINHSGLAQLIQPALRCTDHIRTDGRILMELSGRTGLFHSASIRAEIAASIPAFKSLETGELGELGKQVLSC